MKYYCIDNDETVEDAQEIPEKLIDSDDGGHTMFTADEVAHLDYKDSGGDLNDPDSWPRTYVLVGDDGVESKWSVSLDYSPDFYAVKVKS